MAEATVFVNVFNFNGQEIPVESNGVARSRKEAVKDAQSWPDRYCYTLTDAGMIDLSSEFDEAFQAKRDFDAAVDRKIDEWKEAGCAAEGR